MRPAPTRAELLDRVARDGWQGLTYPAVLGAIDLDPDDPAARATAARYSSMARAVQRLHTPLLQWLRDCPPDERRALMRQAVRHPFQSAGWLASRVTRWQRA